MSILKCLEQAALSKAQTSPLRKQTLNKLSEEIQTMKAGLTEGDELSRELVAAQKVFDTYQYRFDQKLKQTAIHAEMLSTGLSRFKEGVDPIEAVRSFLTTSESEIFKHGGFGTSAAELIRSNQRIFTGMATDILEKLDPKRMSMLRDPSKVAEIKKDMYAALRNSGTRSNDESVRAITDQIQALTKRGGEVFEKAGGNIFLRNDYMIGRSPSLDKIAKVSREAYIADGVQAFDLQRVSEATGGTIKTVKQLATALGKDYDAIVSGGISNLAEYAPPGMKSVVNSRFHKRIFHFKTAETDIDWHAKYGEENLYARVLDYAESIGKDVGLLQALGPKPDAFIRSMLREAAAIDPNKAREMKDVVMREFRHVTGQWDASLDPTVSKWLSTHRAAQTANKLGFTAIDAVTGDMIALNAVASNMRGIPALQSMKDSIKRLATSGIKEDYKALSEMGLYAEAFVDDAKAMLQRMDAEGGHKFFDLSARGVLKWTGNTRATQAYRTVKIRQMSNMLAEFVDDGSNPEFANWIKGSGLSMDTLKKAQEFGMEEHPLFKVKMLNPVKLAEAGYEKEAAELGTIFGRTAEVFSPMQNDRFKAWSGKLERGGVAAQIGMGSIKGFTGYISSFWDNHVHALYSMPGTPMTKAKLYSSYATAMIMAGVVQQMVRDTLNGKDPELNSTTMMKGVARSGALPVVGDFLFNGGQNASLGEQLGGTLTNNLSYLLSAGKNAMTGEGVKAGKEFQKFGEQYIPGKNVWYAGLAFQRMILDQIKYLYDPNADKNFKKRASSLDRKTGQDYWWAPGQTAPERAPDLNPLDKQFLETPKKGK